MSTPTEYALLDGLVNALKAITGLHPLHYPGPRMSMPAAIPMLEWPLNRAYGRMAGPVECELIVVTHWGPDGPRTLGDYVNDNGAKSITAALTSVPGSPVTLGGVVSSIHVYQVSAPRLYQYPDNAPLWGRSIRMKLYV